LRRMKLKNEVGLFESSFNRFGYSDTNALLRAIGTGIITVREMLRKLKPIEDIKSNDRIIEETSFFDFSRQRTKGIVLDGINNVLINFGKCCNPIPGDDLIGFVTRGRGVTVHRTSCKSLPLLNNESDRLVPVEWNVKSSDQFNVLIKVVGQDYKGWLKDISECISKQNINIASVDIKVNENIAEAKIIVNINNNRQLNRLMKKITNLKNIDYVERAGR